MTEPSTALFPETSPTWRSRLGKVRADLVLGALTLALLLLGLNGWPEVMSGVHLVLGVVAVLWLPGYMLTLTLFPGQFQLTGTERGALSVAFSVGILAIFALLLGRTHLGLRSATLLYLLTAWFLLTALADLVRGSVNSEGRYRLGFGHRHARVGSAAGVALVLALLLLNGLVQFLQPRASGSELMVLGPDGTLSGYTTRVQAGMHLRIPVRFHYQGTTPTSFQIKSNAGPPTETGVLQPGQTWNGQVVVVAPQVLGTTDIQIRLSGTAPSVERRQIHLELEVIPAL